MYQLDPPQPPAMHDLEDLLSAANAALAAAWAERHRIEAAIRQATAIEDLAPLHDAWRVAIEELEAADARQAELLQLIATLN